MAQYFIGGLPCSDELWHHSMSCNSDFLAHYGRKGMKWGKKLFETTYERKTRLNGYNLYDPNGGRTSPAATISRNLRRQGNLHNGRGYLEGDYTSRNGKMMSLQTGIGARKYYRTTDPRAKRLGLSYSPSLYSNQGRLSPHSSISQRRSSAINEGSRKLTTSDLSNPRQVISRGLGQSVKDIYETSGAKKKVEDGKKRVGRFTKKTVGSIGKAITSGRNWFKKTFGW